MKIISLGKGKGKTTKIIEKIKENFERSILVVSTDADRDICVGRNKSLLLKIYTFDEIKRISTVIGRLSNLDNVYIDNADMFLQSFFPSAKINTITVTEDKEVNEEKNVLKEENLKKKSIDYFDNANWVSETDILFSTISTKEKCDFVLKEGNIIYFTDQSSLGKGVGKIVKINKLENWNCKNDGSNMLERYKFLIEILNICNVNDHLSDVEYSCSVRKLMEFNPIFSLDGIEPWCDLGEKGYYKLGDRRFIYDHISKVYKIKWEELRCETLCFSRPKYRFLD